jgi:hypothetical protein
MATRKKGKKVTQSKPASVKKVTAARRTPKKKTAKKLIAKKRGAATSSRKKTGTAAHTSRKPARKNSRREAPAFEKGLASRSGGQSGDLQGLSDFESADSESVDELLEEGNAFEAGIVEGVEDAEDDQPREVHTHEVPEDDVPEEYQDKD